MTKKKFNSLNWCKCFMWCCSALATVCTVWDQGFSTKNINTFQFKIWIIDQHWNVFFITLRFFHNSSCSVQLPVEVVYNTDSSNVSTPRWKWKKKWIKLHVPMIQSLQAAWSVTCRSVTLPPLVSNWTRKLVWHKRIWKTKPSTKSIWWSLVFFSPVIHLGIIEAY